MIFKFFRKKNGDVIEFYINENNKTITKYKNEVIIKNKIKYIGNYKTKLRELCDDEEERCKVL